MSEKYSMDLETQGQNVGQPIMETLINEHKILLASLFRMQIANRVMLGILALFQITPFTQSFWQQFALTVVGTLIIVFWFVRESWVDQQLNQIGDLIAQTDVDERWKQVFIKWGHEMWQHSNYKRFLGLEPFVWLVIIVIIAVISSLSA